MCFNEKIAIKTFVIQNKILIFTIKNLLSIVNKLDIDKNIKLQFQHKWENCFGHMQKQKMQLKFFNSSILSFNGKSQFSKKDIKNNCLNEKNAL